MDLIRRNLRLRIIAFLVQHLHVDERLLEEEGGRRFQICRAWKQKIFRWNWSVLLFTNRGDQFMEDKLFHATNRTFHEKTSAWMSRDWIGTLDINYSGRWKMISSFSILPVLLGKRKYHLRKILHRLYNLERQCTFNVEFHLWKQPFVFFFLFFFWK